MEVDALNNYEDNEKSSHLQKEEEFDIISHMISNDSILSAIESITDFTETESGKFYSLNQNKLYSWIDSKFDKLALSVAKDEGNGSGEISDNIKSRTGEMLYNEIQSPIIGFSYLTRKLSKTNKQIAAKLFPMEEDEKNKSKPPPYSHQPQELHTEKKKPKESKSKGKSTKTDKKQKEVKNNYDLSKFFNRKE